MSYVARIVARVITQVANLRFHCSLDPKLSVEERREKTSQAAMRAKFARQLVLSAMLRDVWQHNVGVGRGGNKRSAST